MIKSFDIIFASARNRVRFAESAPDPAIVAHRDAVYDAATLAIEPTHERALLSLVRAWCDYADAQSRLGAPIGRDPILGQEWLALGRAINLLADDGHRGRIDLRCLRESMQEVLDRSGFTERLSI